MLLRCFLWVCVARWDWVGRGREFCSLSLSPREATQGRPELACRQQVGAAVLLAKQQVRCRPLRGFAHLLSAGGACRARTWRLAAQLLHTVLSAIIVPGPAPPCHAAVHAAGGGQLRLQLPLHLAVPLRVASRTRTSTAAPRRLMGGGAGHPAEQNSRGGRRQRGVGRSGAERQVQTSGPATDRRVKTPKSCVC